MNQIEKISNRFCDAYLLAMLEGSDTASVIGKFSKDFPELASQFEVNAHSLNILYGDIHSSPKPSDDEIAAAYKKVSERFATSPSRNIAAAPKLGFFAQLQESFKASPRWTGATLGIGLAVVIALLWQPWVIKQSLNQTAENIPSTTEVNPSAPQELASNDQISNDPTKTPEVKFRGKNQKDLLTPTQRNQQDSIDDVKLKAMTVPKQLTAPSGLQVEALSQGSIIIHWAASDDALSYILEMKGANDDSFVPVTQISQTKARITHLESGKTYFVRVIAASGERKGPASDAKSIVVP